VGNLTFDCDDALVVARFWSAVLERPIDHGADSGFASIGRGDADRSEPAWFFERVLETKSAKNRLHLDLIDADPTSVDRLIALGATVMGSHSAGSHGWTVLQDPEGNEFCIGNASYTG
jgi:hypothetical protein